MNIRDEVEAQTRELSTEELAGLVERWRAYLASLEAALQARREPSSRTRCRSRFNRRRYQ